MHLYHQALVIEVQCQLMICKGHIQASKGALQIFLGLTVNLECTITLVPQSRIRTDHKH